MSAGFTDQSATVGPDLCLQLYSRLTHGSGKDQRATGSSLSGRLLTTRTAKNISRVHESVSYSLSRSLLSAVHSVSLWPYSFMNPPSLFRVLPIRSMEERSILL